VGAGGGAGDLLIRMNTVCIECGRLIPVGTGGHCREHSARAYRRSTEWKRTSEQLRAGAVCSACGASSGLEVHHVRQLAGDVGAGRVGPLRVLCGPCHDEAHGKRRRSSGP